MLEGTPYAPRTQPTPGCRFVVRAAMRHGLETIPAGGDFPYEQLGLTYDQARLLWQTADLEVKPDLTAIPAAKPIQHQGKRR